MATRAAQVSTLNCKREGVPKVAMDSLHQKTPSGAQEEARMTISTTLINGLIFFYYQRGA